MRQTVWRLARAVLNNVTNQNQLNQTVYLTHVKWVTGKSKQLEKYFSRFGPVKDVSLFFDAESGLHRGFASLTFVNPESAAAAVQQRPHVIDGDLVGVEFSIPLKPKNKFIVQ
ncbi:SRA stem-loop-interacting RNA-binding protein, mitochondrial [Toxocara canis]|uniref:SRA stem-loop-interacting RNA-binding protein, mitochondrial n=1 Tax=Toxocara canis TaxID=6265 RepID=A0A0B2UTV3_TOXCA|nr:SRA stem-loop-interacting RNA-binding protein, mitochondrial [Toxocara canis]